MPAVVGIGGLLVLWEAVARIWKIPLWLCPAPTDIAVAAWAARATLPTHTWVTFYETIVGFLVAVLVGVPLAALLVSSGFIWRALYPILAAIQSIPKTAIAPLLLVWLGTGELLGHRVVVITHPPGRVADIVPIEIPMPRDLEVAARPAFQDYVSLIRSKIARG